MENGDRVEKMAVCACFWRRCLEGGKVENGKAQDHSSLGVL